MPRPKKQGEKKGNISVSVTPHEKDSVQRTARKLGFSNPARYFLALHEAAHRLELHAKSNFNGERWFVLSQSDAVPEDITVEQAITALVEDRPVSEDASPYTPKRIRTSDTVIAGQSTEVLQADATKPKRRAGQWGRPDSPDAQKTG